MERAKSLGEILAEARDRKMLTQQEVANLVGVEFNTISRWETSRATPRGRNLRTICDVLGITMTELGIEEDEEIDEESPPPKETALFTLGDLTMQLLALPSLCRNFVEIQDRVAIILEEYDMTNTDVDALVSRREALHRLAGIPVVMMGLTASHPVLRWPKPEIINQCAASVSACWELSRSKDGTDLTKAFKGVSAYLPTLEAIVKESSARYHKEAASLVGQCYLLKMLLGWHTEGHDKALQYANEATLYSREAGDTTLWLAVQDYASWMHYYDRRYTRIALRTAEQTVPMLKDKGALPPRLMSGLYSTLAVMQAKNGQKASATLKKAADAFFANGGNEEHRFLYMDYGQSELILNDGMVMYYEQDYARALDSFGQIMDLQTLAMKRPLPERSKIEMLNLMALSTLKSTERDMEQALHFWHPAIEGAKALQSEQRFEEASMTYEIMEALWPGEKTIKGLRELAVHW